MSISNNHRKKKKYICPNPLFEKWLTEWKEEAAEKGLKSQYIYAKALASLRKYPLPLSSGKEAKILQNFGDKICSMLDTKLLEWKQSLRSSTSSSHSSGSASSSHSSGSASSSHFSGSTNSSHFSATTSSSHFSGSASNSQSSTGSSSYSLQSSIQSSSSVPSSPKQGKICAKGFESSVDVKTIHLGRVTAVSKMPSIDSDVDSPNTFEEYVKFYLFPGSFSIVLCVDNCETYSGQGRNKKLFLSELQKSGVSFDVRKLHVGDFLWIARENGGENRELVLDFIVERKRMDDLARSIKDGRFKEQKFRMKSCGLKSPIYLVEKCRESSYLGLPVSTCEQAITNTQIIDGFVIKKTSNVKESANYLSTMTNMLRRKFENSPLMSAPKEALQKKKFPPNTFMTFTEFNTSSIKNKSLTVREMFAKHLLQFFGLSVDRAAAIVDMFETPTQFLQAYDNCETETEKEKLVASIKFGMHKKNIGPALSRTLYQFYCAESPPK